MIINVNHYTKIIKKKSVLNNINLTFQSGKIYGISGKNGCGKTMLLRAICGLILPTSGEVIIDGKVIGKDIEFPDSVGIIIENVELLSEYSGIDNLRLIARINRIATDEDIKESMNFVGLEPYDKKKVKAYSLGMKQKLNIAQAIMEKPKLLLLDEPTNALDEESINSIRELLLKFKKNDSLIIIASHNKDDLNILCDEIINLSAGEVV